MESSNTIKEGEWFCAIEGLAIAERIYKIYFEEYDRIPQDKKIGDLNMSVVQYRLFCDFDGHPIKRNRFKYFKADYCSPMRIKWERILKKSISNNPKEYASFEKFLKQPKELKGCVRLEYVFDVREKDNVISGMNAIREKLPSRFTFSDLQRIAEDNHFAINLKDFTDDTFGAPIYIRIYLVFIYGDSIGKNILFNRLDFEIHERVN